MKISNNKNNLRLLITIRKDRKSFKAKYLSFRILIEGRKKRKNYNKNSEENKNTTSNYRMNCVN